MSIPTLLERAFQLCTSGECTGIGDLEKRLKREGYQGVTAHLAGKSLRRQLASAIRQAVPDVSR